MLIALNLNQVTIISRAGSGNTESSSTNTVAAPPLHTVVINEIIKEQGQNVSEDVNNAVQVANKRNAVIKRVQHFPLTLQEEVQLKYL